MEKCSSLLRKYLKTFLEKKTKFFYFHSKVSLWFIWQMTKIIDILEIILKRWIYIPLDKRYHWNIELR